MGSLAAEPKCSAEGLGLGQLLLGLRLLKAADEQRLVDPSLEDRDAHFHALRDDLAPVHSGLASEFGGRQVDRHVLEPPRRLLTCIESIGCCRRRKLICAICVVRSASGGLEFGRKRTWGSGGARVTPAGEPGGGRGWEDFQIRSCWVPSTNFTEGYEVGGSTDER